MVNNQICNRCAFAPKCLACSKLKPFTAEAKVDLGVTLTFNSCVDFKEIEIEDEKDVDN